MAVSSLRNRTTAGLVLGVLAIFAVVGVIVSAQLTQGADHADAPALSGDGGADINDIYAFRNGDNLVVALTVNPLTEPAATPDVKFDQDVSYNIHVSNDGDLTNGPEATVSFTFEGPPYTFTATGLGDPISGPVTEGFNAPEITEAGGISIFAGPRDDPFFFDLVGFNAFVAGPFAPAAGLRGEGDPPADTLAGTNVTAIVLELPIVALTGAETSDTGEIQAWATTTRGGSETSTAGLGAQVDRMAIPGINTVLIPSDQKDAFNAGDPSTDVADWLETVTGTIQGLRDAVAPILGPEPGGPLGDIAAADLAAILIPDVVTIDFSADVAFPNGRQLTDDVIDTALGLILNNAAVGDAIDGNDLPFLDAFPYLAAPQQPAAPSGEVLALNTGGQFVFADFSGSVATIFGSNVRIVWRFNPDTVTWTSYVPQLGVENYMIAEGDVLWVVSDSGDDIPLP